MRGIYKDINIMEDRYLEVEVINDTESEPLIKIMPPEYSSEILQMDYVSSVESGDMILNGRLITAVIRNCGQFVNYIVHVDDGIYHTYTVSGLSDTMSTAKLIVTDEIRRSLNNPL